ncbi:MAG: hypothetical protein PHT69_12520 [Bacteroidales bacterium]|nr:hypothetical protein [Bacteroidales bacterium]
MQRNNYIITLVFSLCISMSIIYYILDFRYNSAIYTLMKISSLSEQNNQEINQLCNLESFADSLNAMFWVFENNPLIKRDSAFIVSMRQYYSEGNFKSYFFQLYNYIKTIDASMIYQIEKRKNRLSYVYQSYKLGYSNIKVVLKLIFLREKGTYLLQYIDKIYCSTI